jgi:uncharacterized protein (DUF2267 family)
MTWPLEYQKAPFEFERFMVAARDAAGLNTTNMAWTMVEGVFLAFRRRLHISQAIEFSNLLPPMVRALFVQDWHPQDPPAPFGSREAWMAEVRSLRPEHNFSPDGAVEAVAAALRRVVDEEKLDRLLASIGPEAKDFWTP